MRAQIGSRCATHARVSFLPRAYRYGTAGRQTNECHVVRNYKCSRKQRPQPTNVMPGSRSGHFRRVPRAQAESVPCVAPARWQVGLRGTPWDTLHTNGATHQFAPSAHNRRPCRAASGHSACARIACTRVGPLQPCVRNVAWLPSPSQSHILGLSMQGGSSHYARRLLAVRLWHARSCRYNADASSRVHFCVQCREP